MPRRRRTFIPAALLCSLALVSLSACSAAPEGELGQGNANGVDLGVECTYEQTVATFDKLGINSSYPVSVLGDVATITTPDGEIGKIADVATGFSVSAIGSIPVTFTANGVQHAVEFPVGEPIEASMSVDADTTLSGHFAVEPHPGTIDQAVLTDFAARAIGVPAAEVSDVTPGQFSVPPESVRVTVLLDGDGCQDGVYLLGMGLPEEG